MKPVVARLVVFGAAVGSLVLLAGAVTLVFRLAHPIEYPMDRSRPPGGGAVAVAYDPFDVALPRPTASPTAPTRRVAQLKAPAPVPAPAPPAVVTPPAAPAPPPVIPAPARPAPVAPASALPRPAAPAPEPPVRAPEPARPSEPDTDGSAAVDWFLKGRR